MITRQSRFAALAQHTLRLGLVAVLAGCSVLDSTPDVPLGQEGNVTGFLGVAISDEPQAAFVGKRILSAGGNAADAAAAMGFTLSVTLPSRASLGSGGACLVYNPSRSGPGFGLPEALLFDPIAPANPGRADRPASAPMLARGLLALQARYGTLQASAAIAPAEQLARFGTIVSRALRKDLAEKANVPPFVIFGDTSLQEMAYYLPQDKNSFARISGVGIKKLQDLSEPFLRVVINFTKENNLEPLDIPAARLPRAAKNPPNKNSLATRELIKQKIPLEEIAKRQGLKVGTIVEHLQRLTDASESFDLAYLDFPQEKLEVIRDAFEKCGNEKLKPVFEYLEGNYSYDDIRLAKIMMGLDNK